MAEQQPSNLRTLIVILATAVWAVAYLLPTVISKLPPSPGITETYIGLLGAALALPEIERIRKGRRGDGDDDGDDPDDRPAPRRRK